MSSVIMRENSFLNIISTDNPIPQLNILSSIPDSIIINPFKTNSPNVNNFLLNYDTKKEEEEVIFQDGDIYFTDLKSQLPPPYQYPEFLQEDLSMDFSELEEKQESSKHNKTSRKKRKSEEDEQTSQKKQKNNTRRKLKSSKHKNKSESFDQLYEKVQKKLKSVTNKNILKTLLEVMRNS